MDKQGVSSFFLFFRGGLDQTVQTVSQSHLQIKTTWCFPYPTPGIVDDFGGPRYVVYKGEVRCPRSSKSLAIMYNCTTTNQKPKVLSGDLAK